MWINADGVYVGEAWLARFVQLAVVAAARYGLSTAALGDQPSELLC